ncbi:MAG: hypothetical protein U0232_33715, partial [Thermomicrobiales bacterium]
REILRTKRLSRPTRQFANKILPVQIGRLRRCQEVKWAATFTPKVCEQVRLAHLATPIQHRELLAPGRRKVAQGGAFVVPVN